MDVIISFFLGSMVLFQIIMVLGMIQSYGVVNIMAGQFAPHLVKEGEIE